jgi:UDP-2,4-diacetamido-2,4,6-trideoxy-beta-L-altropyranose hydrolase
MNVFFRVDASLTMGTGHVMRCLSLANALRDAGAQCYFICGEHPGNLIAKIEQQNFVTYALPLQIIKGSGNIDNEDIQWESDASETIRCLQEFQVDWLVVDHYGLDIQWERCVRVTTRQLMVIDDLANRHHDCDLLLDQNLGRTLADYQHLVPKPCKVMVGPTFALLRPEFSRLRPLSLVRRQSGQIQHLLINVGGLDPRGVTLQILTALKSCELASDLQVTVVVGANPSHLAEISNIAAQFSQPISVRTDVADMAQVMANSDLAIGAAGSSSWERCCLGLPTLLVILAQNQRLVAEQLAKADSALLLGEAADVSTSLPLQLKTISDGKTSIRLSQNSRLLVDGLGTKRINSLLCHWND